jgi:N-acyl-D-aspartate/D-glutamate deacylase
MDVSFTLARRSLMYLFIPGWWTTLGDADAATKMAVLRDPATRRRLVDGLNNVAMLGMAMDVEGIIVKAVAHDTNRDYVGRRVGDIAAERGVTPGDALIDVAMEDELGTWFLRQSISHDDTEAVAGLLRHPGVLIGASDAGAHSGTFASYGDTGLLMSRFVRESGYFRLEEAVKRITFDPSRICGFTDRGLLAPGYAADLVLFDPATIDRGPEVHTDDFPGGGRWTRASVGVHATIVNGALAWSRAGGYQPVRAGKVGGL